LIYPLINRSIHP